MSVDENIELCDEIQDKLAKLSDSDSNKPNTWLLVGELETKVIELKLLYKQIIIK